MFCVVSREDAEDSGPVVVVSSSFGAAPARVASAVDLIDQLPDTRRNPSDAHTGFAGSEACTLPSELDPTPRPPQSAQIMVIRPRLDPAPDVERLRDEVERLREFMLELGQHAARMEASYERQREHVQELERRALQRNGRETRAILLLTAALVLLSITTFVVFGPLR
jgi:hypothetical protein